jgi:hypothetical protein
MEKQLVLPVWRRFMELFPNYSPGRRFAVRESLTAPKGSQLLRAQINISAKFGISRRIWQEAFGNIGSGIPPVTRLIGGCND